MSRFSADAILDGLTDFQRRTVEHVYQQLHNPQGSGRFLVADETGLGKSMVARGLIAKTVERLQDEAGVKRIDIVYVCANADLALQNIRRLNVTPDEAIAFSSRLTMLARHTGALDKAPRDGKPVNLVSFTPGTSFEMGHSNGTAQERALLFLLLNEIYQFTRADQTALKRILQGQVHTLANFTNTIYSLEAEIEKNGGIDSVIHRRFDKELSLGEPTLDEQLQDLVCAVTGRPTVPQARAEEPAALVRELRRSLATASVESLEPDLVILDEFQRFRHLLSEDSEAGELAHQLFNYKAAKVLLLSATPYKAFTYGEESGEDHASDFLNTVNFLAEGHGDMDVSALGERLTDYRVAVTRGQGGVDVTTPIQTELLKIMSRAERPRVAAVVARREVLRLVEEVTPADLAGYAALHDVARAVKEPRDSGLVTAEYWKSAPYFVNFCDTYKLGERIKGSALTQAPFPALARTHRLRKEELETFAPLDGGNAKMRDLVAHTVDQGWWKLLWVPPSMPYLQPGGPYVSVDSMTKMLVFSSWTATPTAVASILSYEAERRAVARSGYDHYTADARKRQTRPLGYKLRDRLPAEMTTLLVSWPMPEIAKAGDPLALVAANGGEPLTAEQAHSAATESLQELLGRRRAEREPGQESDVQERLWPVAFSRPEAWPEAELSRSAFASYAEGLAGRQTTNPLEADDEHAQDVGISAHIEAAAEALASGVHDLDGDQLDQLASIALHSPANIAFRSLSRIIEDTDHVGAGEHFAAAAAIANGFRSLFNRPDVSKLVEQLTDDAPYWQRVLQYCCWGNLQATLDEYVHHLRGDQFAQPFTPTSLVEFASLVAASISLRTSTYQALNADDLTSPLTFVPRFAVRYGGRKNDADDARQPEVRRSFNGPFWPFVLASTSVGQEGIDFHWWSHAVFHWNVPPNPVDFEQREGRVDRYRGHAIRRNVAAKHGSTALSDPGRDPWRRAFELAKDLTTEYGDFTPNWVYPGPAQIERHLAPFALSSDEERYRKTKRDVALYRLTFGQPRQEDMLELLRQRQDTGERIDPATFRIDLMPPEIQSLP